MNGIGDKMVERLKAVERCGGWLAAGYDFGPNNRLHILLDAGLVCFNGRDYVVTAAGRRMAVSGVRRAHRRTADVTA